MRHLYITGMSGVGKSTCITALQRFGHVAVDTDYGEWCTETVADGRNERILRVDAVRDLLRRHAGRAVFVSGCWANQRELARDFAATVLLSAPLPVLLERVRTRTSNPYGKSAHDIAEITANHRAIQPLLQAGCDVELDTQRLGPDAVVARLLTLAAETRSTARRTEP